MMDAFTTRLSNTLREKLEAEAHDIGQKLTIAVEQEYPAYRERVGFAKGLRRAVEMLSEIEKNLSRTEDVDSSPLRHKHYEA